MNRFYRTEWELSGPQLVYDAISADSGGLLSDSIDILIIHWISVKLNRVICLTENRVLWHNVSGETGCRFGRVHIGCFCVFNSAVAESRLSNVHHLECHTFSSVVLY